MNRKMNLRWDTGQWLEEGQHVFPDVKSARDFADDQGIKNPTIKSVSIIVDTMGDCERAWVIKDVSIPFDFAPYESEKEETKRARALRKLTHEEKIILGLARTAGQKV